MYRLRVLIFLFFALSYIVYINLSGRCQVARSNSNADQNKKYVIVHIVDTIGWHGHGRDKSFMLL